MHPAPRAGVAPRQIRVVVADPTPSTRGAMARMIADAGWARVVAETSELAGACAAVARTGADVLVIDDRLLADAHVLRSVGPPSTPPRVIAVGMGDHPGYAERARRAGAEAWIPKHLAGEQLPPLLRNAGSRTAA